MIMRAAILALLAVLLAGCATNKEAFTTISGGEAKVFEAPPYEVRGVTQYDQNWIDSQVEGGVAAFGWPRPAPRPAAIETRRAAQPMPLVKKPGIFKRTKAKLKKLVSRKPADQATMPDVWPPLETTPVIVQPPAPKPAAQKAPIDELLTPSSPIPAVRIVR